MRINTITCHDVYNYGASLQAYALIKYLQQEGHDAKIIDYKPDYMCDDYNFWVLPQYVREKKYVAKSKIIQFLYCVYLSKKRFATWRRIKPFKLFKNKFLDCTRCYKSYDELCESPPGADVYIAGSDQIWNVNLTVGRDPAFYLDFGPKNVKRISYAASFALSNIPDEKKDMLKSRLSILNSISVREKTALTILEDLGYSGKKVLDPVFLLSQENWLSLSGESPIIKEDYIIVYDLYNSEGDIPNLAKKKAQEFNCKIVVVNGKVPIKYGDVEILDAGPCEFLNYIKYAKHVITDSFHATAFALIFQIPFNVFNHKNNQSRIVDLLSSIGLDNRFNNFAESNKIENWDTVCNILEQQVSLSKDFLKDSLSI